MFINKESKIRDENLRKVLRFDSQYERVFTAFERIYIQKERASILQKEEWKIPEELEEKVQEVLTRIEQIKWEPYKF